MNTFNIYQYDSNGSGVADIYQGLYEGSVDSVIALLNSLKAATGFDYRADQIDSGAVQTVYDTTTP